MEEGGEQFIQGKLKKCETKLPASEVYAHKNRPIYPERGGTGYLQEDLRAKKLDRKVRGLTGYQACTSAPLYYDGDFWTIRVGERFGTYPKNTGREPSQ